MNFTWNCVMQQRNKIYAVAAVWIVFFHIYDLFILSII